MRWARIKVAKLIPKLSVLPPPPSVDFPQFMQFMQFMQVKSEPTSDSFQGGESQGLTHLGEYFSSEKSMYYEEVRNAIDGWDNSWRLSPWLANGRLSVREVMTVLSDYDENTTANESTYWI
jgi:deoxyribodipyrimidine photo-lyase